MKKITLLISLLVLISAIFTGCTANVAKVEKDVVLVYGDYQIFDTVEDLTERANVVIKGRILNTRTELLSYLMETNDPDPKANPGGNVKPNLEPFIVYTVEITKVYKGDVSKKEIIEVKEFGGETETAIYINKDAVNLEKGEEYLMFLETYENSPATLLNDFQSHYKIKDEKLVKHPRNKLIKENEGLKEMELKIKN